jgi:hypothetical protein
LNWRPGSQGGRSDALSRRKQNLPANGADERIRARFQRLFKKNQLPVKMNVMQPTNASEPNQNINAEFSDYNLKVPLFENQRLQQLWHKARQTDKLYQELSEAVQSKAQKLPVWIDKQKIVSIGECFLNKNNLLRFCDRI